MITGGCKHCAKCCKTCVFLIDNNCSVYLDRDDDYIMHDGGKYIVNGCSSYPTAQFFRDGSVPNECGYRYAETDTTDDEIKLNTL